MFDLHPEETSVEMCFGADAYPKCWSFAHSSDATTDGHLDTNKLKPCMVPMIEQADDCPNDDLCMVIDPEYVETFKEKNYVIPIGSTVTCQAKDVSFMRGITPRAITVESLETRSESSTRNESSIYRMVFIG